MIELGYTYSSHLTAHQVGQFVFKIHIADSGYTHGRRELQNTACSVIVLKITFHINRYVQRNSRSPVHSNFLQIVECFGKLFRRYAHAKGEGIEPCVCNVEIIPGLLEIWINL